MTSKPEQTSYHVPCLPKPSLLLLLAPKPCNCSNCSRRNWKQSINAIDARPRTSAGTVVTCIILGALLHLLFDLRILCWHTSDKCALAQLAKPRAGRDLQSFLAHTTRTAAAQLMFAALHAGPSALHLPSLILRPVQPHCCPLRSRQIVRTPARSSSANLRPKSASKCSRRSGPKAQ